MHRRLVRHRLGQTTAAGRGDGSRRSVRLDAATTRVTLLRGLAPHRTLTVIFVTVDAALRIFLGNAITQRVMIHALARAMVVSLPFG